MLKIYVKHNRFKRFENHGCTLSIESLDIEELAPIIDYYDAPVDDVEDLKDALKLAQECRYIIPRIARKINKAIKRFPKGFFGAHHNMIYFFKPETPHTMVFNMKTKQAAHVFTLDLIKRLPVVLNSDDGLVLEIHAPKSLPILEYIPSLLESGIRLRH